MTIEDDEAVEDLEEAPEEEETEDQDGGEEAAKKLATLADISARTGVSMEDLYAIEVPVALGDETKPVKLGQLKDRYKDAEEYQGWQVKKAEQEQLLSEQTRAFQEASGQAALIIKHFEDLFTAEESQIDWRTLRAEDPQEYLVRKEEFKERRQAIDGVKAKAQKDYAEFMTTQERKAAEQFEAFRSAQEKALLGKIPEWRDEKVFSAEKKELSDFLGSFGFFPQEIKSAAFVDHRLLAALRMGMLYQRTLKNVDKAKQNQRVTQTRALSPGGGPEKPAKTILEKAKRTQSSDDWAKVFDSFDKKNKA